MWIFKFNIKFEHGSNSCKMCQNHRFYFGIHGIAWWDYSRSQRLIWNFLSENTFCLDSLTILIADIAYIWLDRSYHMIKGMNILKLLWGVYIHYCGECIYIIVGSVYTLLGGVYIHYCGEFIYIIVGSLCTLLWGVYIHYCGEFIYIIVGSLYVIYILENKYGIYLLAHTLLKLKLNIL